MATEQSSVTWFGQPVTTCPGTLAELQAGLPSFERRPFGPQGCRNEFLDTIVRMPIRGDEREIPVATVSPQYDLVQHHDVLAWLADGLETIGEEPSELKGTLTLSKYGERMRLRVRLPKYDFDPGDKHPLLLQAYALNSVDKSTALEIHLGWWRQICSNGLKVRVKGAAARRIHLMGKKTASEVGDMLQDQLTGIEAEHNRYGRWLRTAMDIERIERWADVEVSRTWGPHAAARLCHIARTGQDGRIENPFEKALPHKRQVAGEQQVPGAFAPVRNAYHVSQILSWLASHRGTIQDQQERTAEIGRLMRSLLRQKAGSQ